MFKARLFRRDGEIGREYGEAFVVLHGVFIGDRERATCGRLVHHHVGILRQACSDGDGLQVFLLDFAASPVVGSQCAGKVGQGFRLVGKDGEGGFRKPAVVADVDCAFNLQGSRSGRFHLERFLVADHRGVFLRKEVDGRQSPDDQASDG